MSRSDHAESSEPAGEDTTGRSRKATLRTAARVRRDGWTADERRAWSSALVTRVSPLLPASGPVATYWAMGAEADLAPLNHELGLAGRWCLPRVEGRALIMVAITEATPLVRSSFGVTEPAGEGIDPARLAAVLVPGLAFDAAGHRIGYGAGFYDRFLPSLPPSCSVIGVCFEGQVVPAVPAEPHDVAVPVVVTEARVIWTGRGT